MHLLFANWRVTSSDDIVSCFTKNSVYGLIEFGMGNWAPKSSSCNDICTQITIA